MSDLLEERVEALEVTLRDKATELMAMELTLRALIGTHPDKDMAGRVLQVLLNERLDRMRELGFDRGYLPRTARATSEAVTKHVNGWIRLFGVEPTGD